MINNSRRLVRKMKSLEKQFEQVPEKAVLKKAGITSLYERLNRRLNRLLNINVLPKV